MSLLRQFTRGLHVLGNRKAADQEIADEVSQYLEETTAAFTARGLAPDEARRAARLELGGTTAVREQVRGYGWENGVDILFADCATPLAGWPEIRASQRSAYSLWRSASAHPRQFFPLWTPFCCARFLIRIRKKSCACGNRLPTATE